ncbi:MAG: MBL fold metallo-hydrolase [Pirellulales bacterium]|nr:MBL fold metallo-hydrolase [Pirellulales bacterium]
MQRTRVTVLVENTAAAPGLLAEHGLAYWIEHAGRNVLFDTGQGGALAGNAYKLGIRLHDLDALVLSHGHYDHAGGVAEALKTARSMKTHVHPAAFERKFLRNADGTAREIGMPYRSARVIQDRRNRWIAATEPTTVVDGLAATGPVPRLTDFEDTGGPFFLDESCLQPDPLEDDQSVYFDTAEGTVVLLGCAHAGVVNTLNHIRQLTGHRPIHAVIGGMHLVGASPARMDRTIEEFRRLDIKRLAPAHCTGMAFTVALWNAFPGRCQSCPVGTRFEFH